MPTLAGYLDYLRNIVGITTTYLPNNSPVIASSYDIAIEIVNLQLADISSNIYTLCVYNLATDNLINFAQDQPGQCYFVDLRASFKINSFVPGVITESHDESTGQSLLNPEFMKNLTMANLQMLKTPYGRNYMGLAQSYGTLWGST
jgi:hypothetical protein